MEITDIKIRKSFENSKMRAIVSVTFDNQLVIHDIKVIESNNRLFLAMPSRSLSNGTFVDVAHPTNSSFRTELESRVIAEFRNRNKTLST